MELDYSIRLRAYEKIMIINKVVYLTLFMRIVLAARF